MVYVKWTFRVLIALIVLTFLHYTLPQHDIVRITGTFQQRMELGENTWFFAAPDAGNLATTGRDVKFIETAYESGRTMVYRNEDTSWSWPPYFKFNSFNLQAQAGDLISSVEAPRWVAITHYGWRIELFTIFPNAISVRAVDGPDVTIIPWFNIFFFLVVGAILFMLRRIWMQFRERSIEPVLENVSEAWDAADDRAVAAGANVRGAWGRFTNWFWRVIGR